MKRFLATVAAAGAIAGFALAGSSVERTEAAEPSNFLERVVCNQATGESTASFVVPSEGDIDHNLDARGVPGTPDEVWIDLTLFDNDFARGTFLGFGPFGANGDARAFALEGLNQYQVHYYRLNVLVDGRWHELGRAAFGTPDCNTVRQLECDAASGTVDVLFELPAFTLAPGRALESWLDISLFNNGFAGNTFLGVGPFAPPVPASQPSPPPTVTSYRWEGIVSARMHFFRVNVLNDRGMWDQRSFGSFLTPDCRDLVRF